VPAKILIVEDDKIVAEFLGDLLQDEGYTPIFAHDGLEAFQVFQRQCPDLVVLDIVMPRMDGWETCRRIRDISNVPIIMLSGRTDELDKVRGLELGADDYVSKPVPPFEFVARIRAALRRGAHPLVVEDIIRVDDRLAIHRARGEAIIDGQVVNLSAIEFKLLICLLDNAGRISTHQSLLSQVWGWDCIGQNGYVKVYIHQLRKKIEPDPRNPCYILTERGLGYRFQALPVS